jgi:hypothetical protein
MNAFTQMGMDTFNDGIASGMPPEAAANAAGDAMGAAATEMGFPADMVADGVASGMETFTQALANGAPPAEATPSATISAGKPISVAAAPIASPAALAAASGGIPDAIPSLKVSIPI